MTWCHYRFVHRKEVQSRSRKQDISHLKIYLYTLCTLLCANWMRATRLWDVSLEWPCFRLEFDSRVQLRRPILRILRNFSKSLNYIFKPSLSRSSNSIAHKKLLMDVSPSLILCSACWSLYLAVVSRQPMSFDGFCLIHWKRGGFCTNVLLCGGAIWIVEWQLLEKLR